MRYQRSMREALIKAWRTNSRINQLLLERISDQGLVCTLSKRGGQDVAGQFDPVHTDRI